MRARPPAMARARLAIVLLASAAAWPAGAQDSYYRLYEQREGLGGGEVIALTQDRDGFLWLGTNAGVLRFDGNRFMPWAPQRQVGDVLQLCVDAGSGDLVILTSAGRALLRDGDDLVPLAVPEASGDVAAIACARGGGLWAIHGDRLWQRDAASQWHDIARATFGDETPHRLAAGADGMLLLTDRGAWLLHGDAPPRHLLDAADLWAGCDDGHGGHWFATHFGTGLWHVDADGRATAVARPDARALDLVRRGATTWLALDRYLLAYEPDGRVRSFDTAHGFPSGGPLLVDAEGSLWAGTFVGLVQFPEPDTWQWSERHGLPSQHAMKVLLASDGAWIETWVGSVLFRGDPPAAQPGLSLSNRGALCQSRDGTLWGADAQGLWSWRATAIERVAADIEPPFRLNACTEDAGGGLWFAAADELLHWSAATGRAARVTVTGTQHGRTLDLLWSDHQGRLWSAAGESVCRLQAAADGADMQSVDCLRIPVGESIFDAREIAPGRFWLASHRGLWRFDGTRAEQLVDAGGFPGSNVRYLSASPRGGYWIAGLGRLLRLSPCDDCASGWTVLEHPGGWQGLPGNGAVGAVEAPNGDLWVAGNRGAWRVPARARATPPGVPPLHLVGITVDNREVTPGTPFDLRPGEHQLGLDYAALSYRDRSLLRFRSRLDGGEWSVPTTQSNLQWVDLPDGRHRIEMQASLDGRAWSASAPVEFTVVPPWYRRAWAWALYALLAAALATLLYRWRVAMLLRVERERSHIAMDLHDEMGASLGSIGMLAEVAARGETAGDERRKLATEIAAIAGLLGGGLRSLVWSMRSDRAGMAELAAQIVDHARRLFPAEPPRLRIALPAHYPPTPVRADVRRHVLLIALEAMHNAARHAHAREVQVELRADGDTWTLRIGDDGRGFDTGGNHHGTGLESMRRRASAIGARFELRANPAGGSVASLRFRPFRAPPASHDRVLARRWPRIDSGAA